MEKTAFPFRPEDYEAQLRAIYGEIDAVGALGRGELEAILRRHPKDGRGFFSKSELIRGLYHFHRAPRDEARVALLVEKLRMKPVRTSSGVAPVTVLTHPYPCPGRCIFCPSDVRMPKSYLSDEPGAQRAAEHQFDPYGQTFSRLVAFHHTGHVVDKVELIILGGTWSSYPEEYQLWFLRRSFEAMNDFPRGGRHPRATPEASVDFRAIVERVEGGTGRTYNDVVRRALVSDPDSVAPWTGSRWRDLEEVQRRNESARVRCVGLVVETRPDHLNAEEVRRIRRLGATKVQIGYQSLSDEVLAKNRRGHDLAATRRAMSLLRQAGFKIHAHWMPNLYGSTPHKDVEDFETLFGDPDFCPDELKIYPTSLIRSAELMAYFKDGRWRPYTHDELLWVVTECLKRTPEYCRLTRVIRDIPGTDIVAGNKLTNFRQVAERELERQGETCRDIRAREIRHASVDPARLTVRGREYRTSVGREIFLQATTPEDRLAGFLRLCLPEVASFIGEIRDKALIREVHVYGCVVGLGARDAGRAQHLGLGRDLIAHALELARHRGFGEVAVISSVGTRQYYRNLGFEDGALYQHYRLGAAPRGGP